MMRTIQMRPLLAGLITIATMAASQPAMAQEAERYRLDLPAEPLSAALRDLAAVTNRNIVAASPDTEGKGAPALAGSFTLAEAIDHLLTGTRLHAEAVDGGFIIRPGARQSADTNGIVVTGTRIAGAPVAAEVISISRNTMAETGYTDLGRLVRDIPQSFGGGQNPGVGTNVPASRGVDIGGASSINLRGLGSDATLTLLNGHRVPYTASRQSVDVSAIPLGIVDHIEIVPDGASALYGSDAVAGVANIVLRRDMKGFETDARVGGSTDGGNFQQQYGFAGGDRWKNGGVIAAYDYSSSDAIWGYQRSYARNVAPNLMLMPALWHHAVALAGHQSLTDSLTFETDAYYNIRRERDTYPQQSGTTLGTGNLDTRDQIWGVAPTLKLQLASGWKFNLAGTTGRERVDLTSTLCLSAPCTTTASSYYRNSANSIEFNGDGTLINLPGGPLKLAFGAGYRVITFVRYAGVGSAVNTQHNQDSTYAFGELAVPIIGPSQNIPFVERLSASAAVRYERYPGVANVATPKFGLIYAPSDDLDIKASWGKSFRVPTLYEQYQPRSIYLYPAKSVGATGLPATAAVLLIVGGSPTLKPERANTWSTGVTFHPRATPGLKLEVTYFNIHYQDRIVTPITTLSQALSNAIYKDEITASPDAATQAAAIAASSTYVNATSYAYNAANVTAIVDNSNVNAGHQWAQGIDILAEYGFALGEQNHLKLNANASYLDSRQQLSASQPITQLAGTIFSPPHWRGQAGVTWNREDATLNLLGHYIGGVIDNRYAAVTRLGSMTTLDITARYALHQLLPHLEGVNLTVSVQNIFNAKPTQIVTSTLTDTPYDSANYSPVGRFASFAVSTKW